MTKSEIKSLKKKGVYGIQIRQKFRDSELKEKAKMEEHKDNIVKKAIKWRKKSSDTNQKILLEIEIAFNAWNFKDDENAKRERENSLTSVIEFYIKEFGASLLAREVVFVPCLDGKTYSSATAYMEVNADNIK